MATADASGSAAMACGGRNAHAPLGTLAAAYREVAQAAGLSL